VQPWLPRFGHIDTKLWGSYKFDSGPVQISQFSNILHVQPLVSTNALRLKAQKHSYSASPALTRTKLAAQHTSVAVHSLVQASQFHSK